MITLKATLCRKKQMKSKSYVVIVFGRYVRIALQKSRYNYVRKLVRFTSENYAIKPCKWEQKSM